MGEPAPPRICGRILDGSGRCEEGPVRVDPAQRPSRRSAQNPEVLSGRVVTRAQCPGANGTVACQAPPVGSLPTGKPLPDPL